MPAVVQETIPSSSRLQGLAQELLTLGETAAVLRCSKAHVSNLINGKLPGLDPLPVVEIGRRKLVRCHSLACWIEHAEASGQELI